MTKVAVAQFAMKSGVPNIDRIAAMCKEAAKEKANLLVFPELSLPGYDLGKLKTHPPLAETDFLQALRGIAKESGVAIFAGIATKDENIAVLVEQDQTLLRYSKCHLFDFKSARESDLFRRGESPLQPIVWRGFSLAALICFDLRFPELARYYHDQGANLLLLSSAWPASRAEIFFTLARARAIENQSYLLSSNFVGENESGDSFAGSSAIFAPDGTVLAQLGSKEEGILYGDLSLATVNKTRSELNCRAKQRGPDFYR